MGVNGDGGDVEKEGDGYDSGVHTRFVVVRSLFDFRCLFLSVSCCPLAVVRRLLSVRFGCCPLAVVSVLVGRLERATYLLLACTRLVICRHGVWHDDI